MWLRIDLPTTIVDALSAWAKTEYRTTTQQAAYLLRECVLQRHDIRAHARSEFCPGCVIPPCPLPAAPLESPELPAADAEKDAVWP